MVINYQYCICIVIYIINFIFNTIFNCSICYSYACALGFSTPTAIMVGVGIESNYGYLVIGLIDINSDVFNIVYDEVSLIVIAIKHHQLQIYYRYQFKLHESNQ